MTETIADSCSRMGWSIAAKGYECDLLPQQGQEFLSLDGMAFAKCSTPREPAWLWPLAVFELENDHTDDRTAYSLWKVLNILTPLRVVVAYRRTWEEANALPRVLAEQVIRTTMSIEQWNAIQGEVLLVIGSRSDGQTFPWDYFRFWKFDPGIGRFVKTVAVEA